MRVDLTKSASENIIALLNDTFGTNWTSDMLTLGVPQVRAGNGGRDTGLVITGVPGKGLKNSREVSYNRLGVLQNVENAQTSWNVDETTTKESLLAQVVAALALLPGEVKLVEAWADQLPSITLAPVSPNSLIYNESAVLTLVWPTLIQSIDDLLPNAQLDGFGQPPKISLLTLLNTSLPGFEAVVAAVREYVWANDRAGGSVETTQYSQSMIGTLVWYTDGDKVYSQGQAEGAQFNQIDLNDWRAGDTGSLFRGEAVSNDGTFWMVNRKASATDEVPSILRLDASVVGIAPLSAGPNQRYRQLAYDAGRNEMIAARKDNTPFIDPAWQYVVLNPSTGAVLRAMPTGLLGNGPRAMTVDPDRARLWTYEEGPAGAHVFRVVDTVTGNEIKTLPEEISYVITVETLRSQNTILMLDLNSTNDLYRILRYDAETMTLSASKTLDEALLDTSAGVYYAEVLPPIRYASWSNEIMVLVAHQATSAAAAKYEIWAYDFNTLVFSRVVEPDEAGWEIFDFSLDNEGSVYISRVNSADRSQVKMQRWQDQILS